MKHSMKESYSKVAIEAITDKSQCSALFPTVSVNAKEKRAIAKVRFHADLDPDKPKNGLTYIGQYATATEHEAYYNGASYRKSFPRFPWNGVVEPQPVEVDPVHDVDVDSIAEVVPVANGDQATAEEKSEYFDIRLHIKKMIPSLGLKAVVISFDVGV